MGPSSRHKHVKLIGFLGTVMFFGVALPTWVHFPKSAHLHSTWSRWKTVQNAASTFGASLAPKGNAMERLSSISKVIPDEFGFDEFGDSGPSLAIVTSRTVLQALREETWTLAGPAPADLVAQALRNEKCAVEWDVAEEGQDCFLESLFTLIGTQLLGRQSAFARISTELPLPVTASTGAALRSARRLIDMYEDLGVAAERVLLRVPASYSGLRLAHMLSEAGFSVHVTHVYSTVQAALAKLAKAFAVQVYVNRIDHAGGDGIAVARDINQLLNGADGKRDTALVVASLSTVEDVAAVAGAEYLLVPSALFKELANLPHLPGATNARAIEIGRSRVAPKDGLSSFLCPPEDFDAALPAVARQLLAAGLQKYEQEREALHQLVADAEAHM